MNIGEEYQKNIAKIIVYSTLPRNESHWRSRGN